MSTFCQHSYNRKCQPRGVGGQKKPKFCQCTLYSIINVGPTFINFGFFPGPTSLLKALCLLNFIIFSMGYFWQIFHALRLLFLSNFPGPTFIPYPTSIPDPRVVCERPFSTNA